MSEVRALAVEPVTMEGNAVGMVPRLALKTRFCQKRMEFDSSAFRQTKEDVLQGATEVC